MQVVGQMLGMKAAKTNKVQHGGLFLKNVQVVGQMLGMKLARTNREHMARCSQYAPIAL